MIKGVVAAAFGVLAFASSAPAAFTLSTQASSPLYAQGGSGFFDVFLTGVGTTAGTLSDYGVSFVVTGPGPSPLATFSPPIENTNYVFPGSLGPFAGAPIPGVVDEQHNDAGSRQILDGVTYGLGRVFFNVSPGATLGNYTIDYVDSNSLFVTAAPFSFTQAVPYTAAAFTIVTPSAVPEPGSLILLGLVGVGGVAVRMRRKKAAETVDPVTAA